MRKLIYGLQLPLILSFVFAACSKDLVSSSATDEELSLPTAIMAEREFSYRKEAIIWQI
ncbi:hypothetical protein [Sphingobacterium sp. UME9]|uniref:hypothetical protein n=1 Tax=Sphingobacterium sp. UME9 TaxID=1862316 RepID=UPI0015FF6FA4|nr:hypothetical protein [Sphingobacterium sp. UME9]